MMILRSRRMLLLKVFILVLGLSTWLFSRAARPPAGHTGGFEEPTCHACHNSFGLNTGRDLGGDFNLSGVPGKYVPGEAYQISATISQPGLRRWGFQVAVRNGDGEQAGNLEVIQEDHTQVITSPEGIQYLSQTGEGTYLGLEDGPVTWEFRWSAPEKSMGQVFFHASGNAANGDGSRFGDYIYTTSEVSRVPEDDQ